MSIQVTLSANEFNHTGTYDGREYTSLRIKSISNGRVYFFTIRDQMKLSTMAKQMKLVDGNVIISFGKNDKLIIGTYTDDSIQEETVNEVAAATEQTNDLINFTNVKDSWNELKLGNKVLMNNNELDSLQEYIDTLSDEEQDIYYKNFSSLYENKYACGLLTRCYICELKNVNKEQTEEEEVVTLTCSKSLHGFGHSVWINDNRNTNQSMTYYNPNGNESVTIHMHANNYDKYWEVENYIYSLMKEYAHSSDLWTVLIDKLNSKYNPVNEHAAAHSPIQETKPATKEVNKPNKIEEVFPKLDMVAEYAKVNYKDNIAEVTFTNATESHTIKLNKHKRWSHKKYVNKAIEHTGIKPSWEFRYGWEYIS